MAKQRLELTWIGKGNEPKLEPRILIEDTEKSYGSRQTENMLIHGDNLLALKALEQDFTGRIKCIYIDPPYNTGSAFEQYDDGVEHSLWLNLITPRLRILRNLLTDDGSIWISIDDNEGHYLKVLCDEIFGRSCFAATVIWKSTDNSNNDAKQFSVDHNMTLVYSKKKEWKTKRLDPNPSKRKHFKNPDNDPKGAWFDGNPISSPNYRENLIYDLTAPNGNVISPPANGWRWSKETMKSKMDSGEIKFTKDGKRIKRRTYLSEQKGLPPSTLWADLDETGHNRQAKYEQKKLFPGWAKAELFATPKPEKLIQKIFKIATEEEDYVLDSFLGSATTAAVAHKMNRKWIGIELGEQANTHCLPRMKKVVDGLDEGGITKAVKWEGGGGFRFFNLAPSLLKKDALDNLVINADYNPNMLAAAMAKQEGYAYAPDEVHFWKQGISTENDYIYTTTQYVTVQLLDKIKESMGENESLLICCKSYADGCDDAKRYPNINIKKIPSMLLGKCEFDQDDYSFNIITMPKEEEEEEFIPAAKKIKAEEEAEAMTKEGAQKKLF